MDASDQKITLRARKFANRLHGRFGIAAEMFDERLTSAAAREEIFEFGGYRKLKKTQISTASAPPKRGGKNPPNPPPPHSSSQMTVLIRPHVFS